MSAPKSVDARGLASRLAGLSPEKQALLARRLAERDATPSAGDTDRVPRRAASGRAPLTFAQELLWLHEQKHPGTTSYTIAVARRVRGALDVDRLQRALDALMARHEALRTTFVELEGAPWQVVGVPSRVRLDIQNAVDEATALAGVRRAAAEPFALERGPLFRATLARWTPHDAFLLLAAHHLVLDGGSVDLLLHDLAAMYDERGDALPALEVQLADIATWERQTFDDARSDAAVRFWRDQLAGVPAAIDLPTDRPRRLREGTGARYATTLPPRVADDVRALAARTGSTSFMVLLAAFQALLHRLTAQRDLVVGTAVSGRDETEREHVVGYLVNAVPVRARLDDDPSFDDLLGATRTTLLATFEHRRVPFGRVLPALGDVLSAGDGDSSFQVMFGMTRPRASEVRLGQTTLEPLGVDVGAAKGDLALMVTERPDGLRCVVEYRSDLFDEVTIERIVAQFGALVRNVAHDPTVRVSRISLVSEADRERVLAWGVREPVSAASHTMHGSFERWAEAQPEAIALRFEGRTMTYGALDRSADALAARLRDAGIGRGTIVGLCVERSFDFPIGALAVLKAGGAYLPLDSSYPAERLAFMLEDSRAQVLLTQRALAESLPPAPRVLFVDDVDAAAPHAGRVDAGACGDDVAYVIYTSGSTGRPKGALLLHRGACNLAAAIGHELQVRPDDRVLQFAALSFDASVLELLWSLGNGASLQLVPQSEVADPPALADLVERERVTSSLMPPVMLRALDASRMPTLRTLLSGGEACGADIVERWAPGRRLFNAYGPTETTVMPTMARLGPDVQGLPIGGPLPGCRLYVLDAAGALVPVGVPGELHVGGLGVGAGYLDRPDLTRERFVADPFAGGDARMYRTGDLVRWRADGQLEFLGRIDQQIKLRGFRIEVGEIESALTTQPAVSAAAVVVRPSPLGDQLVAYVVPRDGKSVDAPVLLAALRATLPAFMIPAAIVRLDAMPMTPSGKLDRAALPAPSESDASPDAFVEPRDDVERVVAGVWRDVLRRDRIGVDTDFFALGGQSLLATRIVGQLSRIFRVALPLRAFFQTPTIAGLARTLAGLEAAPGRAATIARLYLRALQMSPEEREQLRRGEGRAAQTTGTP